MKYLKTLIYSIELLFEIQKFKKYNRKPFLVLNKNTFEYIARVGDGYKNVVSKYQQPKNRIKFLVQETNWFGYFFFRKQYFVKQLNKIK